MKLLTILIVFLIATSAMGKLNPLNKKAGRTSSPEAVALPFIYLGTCDQFNAIRAQIKTSSIPTGSSTACLPISNVAGSYLDNDDLTADVLCTNIGRNRAQVDFMEIYVTAENTPYNGTYVVSFVPNAPFKAIAAGVTYLRRPTCTIQNDYCSTTSYVHSCTENLAVIKNGFVISTGEEVYTVVGNVGIVGCSLSVNSCCGYVNPTYCPNSNATNQLLNFNFDEHHHDEHHHDDGDHDGDDRDHHHDDHRPHDDHHHDDHRPHHDDGDHDGDDRDHHHDDHRPHDDHHHDDHRPHHEDDGDNDEDDRDHRPHDDHHHDDHRPHKNEVFENDEDDKKKK